MAAIFWWLPEPTGPSGLRQLESCGRNLAKEKEYYRRYRVCKSHASAAVVTLNGKAVRYCQQCSVFHPLGAFDGDKKCVPQTN